MHQTGRCFCLRAWWTRSLHAAIGVKRCQVYLHGLARAHAAQEGTRGAGRKMKYNPGARGVEVFVAVGNGKVLVWEYIDGQRWGGDVAAHVYKHVLAPRLRAEFAGKRAFTVLEDNDPSGFKSSKGVAAKQEVGIKAFAIPPRSPGLNVCDYFLWSHINRQMRAQEKAWPVGKKETRPAYLRRLRRTALRTPADLVTSAMQDMRRRCQRLVAAGGGHFEEGGR